MTGARTPRRLPFVGGPALGTTPHVLVDGALQEATALALSHWPGSTTPAELARDLSAEIAFAYLRSPRHWRDDALAVTNDHVDQDGIVSVHALVDPAHALAHEPLLVGAARAGDFAVAHDHEALALALALGVLAEQPCPVPAAPPGSPVPGSPGPEGVARRTEELLGVLPGLVDSPRRAREIAAEEIAAVEAGWRAVASGQVLVEGPDRAGVATVVVSERVAAVQARRFSSTRSVPLHPVVVHALTDATRVLLVHGRRYRYYDRYETWVRLASTRPALRRALAPLAVRLDEQERPGTRWRADDPGALEPSLEVGAGQESSVPLDRVREIVASYLVDAPAAWDPYAAAGEVALGPVRRPGAPTAGTTGRGLLRSRGRLRGRSSA